MSLDSNFFEDDIMKPLERNLYSKEDDNTPFREEILEYLNAINYNDDDQFFWDFIPFIRFLFRGTDVAFTTPDHIIYLNPPHIFEKKIEYWDAIYAHECMHQLWETFDVGDKIKASGTEFHMMLLNIASDCVINDYLTALRKKELPDGMVTPEYIKEECGIIYNRNDDTQYSLYLKLLAKKEELIKKHPDWFNGETDDTSHDSYGQGQNDNSDSQSQPKDPDYVAGWEQALEDYKNGKIKL